MAFAVTKYQAYGLQIGDPLRKRTVQRVALDITGAATDTSWDLGTLTGTFWTSAIAHATYGAIAIQALADLTVIGTNAKVLVLVGGTIPNTQLRAGSAGSGTYTQTVSNALPLFTFDTSAAPTSATLILEWSMNDDVFETVADFGA